MKRFAVVLLLALSAAAVFAQEDAEEVEAKEVEATRPHVMVLKLYDGDVPVAQGREWNITYTVYNAGESAALDIEVDDTYSEDAFDVVSGEKSFKIDKLAPGASVKKSLVLVPKEAGEYRTQRASVSYKFEDEEEEEGLAEVSAVSSDLGTVAIRTPGEYARLTEKFTLQWAIYLSIAAATVLVPYNAYSSAAARLRKRK